MRELGLGQWRDVQMLKSRLAHGNMVKVALLASADRLDMCSEEKNQEWPQAVGTGNWSNGTATCSLRCKSLQKSSSVSDMLNSGQ